MNSPDFIFGVVAAEPFAQQLFFDLGIIGLVLIGVQAVLTLGFGHHGDFDSGDGHGIPWSNYLSLKSIAALLIGIGFGGALFAENGFSTLVAVAAGMAIGLTLAVAFVAMMKGLNRLKSDGTTQLWEAIGQRGTVYLRIPGSEAAAGEIQVICGGRMINIAAFTRGPELPTGTDVLVTSVHGQSALEVERFTEDPLKLS